MWEVAGNGDAARLERSLPKGERIEAVDHARGTRRVAVLHDGRLAAVLFVTRTGELPSRDWLIGQLGGIKTIVSAIRAQALVDVAAIGAALGAGTNCGSCRPALARLLAETKDVANA